MSPGKITTDKKSKGSPAGISPKTQPLQRKTDARQLIRELEAQNEALIRSQAETQAVLRQYTDLYDFAPISYFTLGRDGGIRQANLNGAHLLGVDRDRLIRQNFGLYVSPEFNSDFDSFLERVFGKRGKETCEIVLLKKKHEPIWTHIEATYSDASYDKGVCHLVVNDISENKHAESILQARFRITEFAVEHSLGELLQNALDELCTLTDSPIGFFHFVEPDQHTLSLQTWSTSTRREVCATIGKGEHDDIEHAGVWADCVRRKRPIIHNDYASLPHRKGLPEGHATVVREMVLPVIRNQKVVAVIGVGNKSLDYTQQDMEYALRLADLIWDITERKRAEEALRESESRYRSILEDQTELICRYLPDGRLSYVNEAYARYYGETAQQLINTNFIPHIPEPDLSMVMNKIAEITSKDPAVVYEHRIIKPHGEICWQRWTHRGIYDVTGNLIEHQAVGNDITERKRAEEGLHRYLSELKVLYDNGLAISILQKPREIGRKIIETLSTNLSWHHLAIRLRHGETDDLELIAFNQPDISGDEVIEAEKRLNTLVSKVGQGLSGWSIQTGEALRTGDVRRHPQYIDTYSGICSGLYMPLKVGECVIGGIAVESEESNAFTEQDERFLATLAAQTAIAFENANLYQNIREELRERERAEKALRESEERFRLAVQATKDGLWEWDVLASHEFFSPRWCEILGYSFDDPELPHTYNAWAERIHPDDYERVVGAMTSHLEKGTLYDVDYRHQHKSGEYRWQNSSGQAFFDENGNLVKMVGCISDITERKRVEEALRIAEADYRAIFEGAPIGIFQSTSGGRFIKVNRAMSEMYGYSSPEEMVEKVESIATQIYAVPSVRLKFQSLLAEHGEVKDFMVQNRHKDGNIFWISMTARAVKNKAGEIEYYEGFIQDITARKQAEEQIQLLARFPAEDPNPVLRIAQDGTLLYINDAGLRFLPQWDLQIDGKVPFMLQEAVFRSMQEETTRTLDLEHGDRLYAFYVAPIVSAGYANLYGHDITDSTQVKALEDAEKRYHALFDQSPYGVLLLDPTTGETIEANEIASMQLGYTPEEFAALKLLDYEARENTIELAFHMQRIKNEGSDNFETLHRTKSGEIRNVHAWVKTVDLAEGLFFYATYEDITERKKMEESNEKYSRDITLLEERQRIASDLHDAVSQTLFSARLTAETLLRQVDRQTDAFTRSLVDLNRLVRSASGEIRLILVELRNNALLNVNLTTLLTNLIDSGMARTEANLIFQCYVDDLILPVPVKLAFYRIAQEAISNAIKHGRPSNINCILRENDKSLEMIVNDDGTGFLLQNVSDDHFGLQIMNERAEQAGVKLIIESRPGNGTSITVSWKKG